MYWLIKTSDGYTLVEGEPPTNVEAVPIGLSQSQFMIISDSIDYNGVQLWLDAVYRRAKNVSG